MLFGEIYLVEFPFTSGQETKMRPGLILLDPDDGDVLVARISSQHHASEYSVFLENWEDAGLRLPSFLRLEKLVTIEKQSCGKGWGN